MNDPAPTSRSTPVTPSPSVAIQAVDPGVADRARELARQLLLPLVDTIHDAHDAFDFVLCVASDRVQLLETARLKQKPISVDFVSGAVAYRRAHGGGRSVRQPIARAVGLPKHVPTLVDATAGLGRDAFLLAGLGCVVTAVERSGVVAALLSDGIRRAQESPDMKPIISERLTLVVADAADYLEALPPAERPDVVYLDPMYPSVGNQTAAVKKEMRVLRRLLGPDTDSHILFHLAMRTATRRVVVKRPRIAPPLSGTPAASFSSKNTRFDMYLT